MESTIDRMVAIVGFSEGMRFLDGENLALMALAERETLRERIVPGLEAARRRGKRLGRPVGTTVPPEQMLAKHADVVRLLRAGKSLRDVAARTGKGTSTVKRIRALLRADQKQGIAQAALSRTR